MFYFKSMGTDARRVNNWEAQGPRLANYSCLAAAHWADGAKGGAFVVSCLFRRASRGRYHYRRHTLNTFHASNIAFYLSHS